MARLTAAARRALPDSDFAGPGRTFPVEDAGHAKAALGLVGNAPASARPAIKAAAKRKLNKGSFKAAKHNVHAKGHPGEGWASKETAVRHSRKGANNRFK